MFIYRSIKQETVTRDKIMVKRIWSKLLFYIKIITSILFTTIQSFSHTTNKVLIITHSFDRPEFIELQDHTFKALLQDDYEFLVMNDAPNIHMSKLIEQKCNQLNIKSIKIPREIHLKSKHPTEEVTDSLQYSMDNIGFNHDGIVALIDSDIFLIKPFSITQYLKGFDLSGHKQQRPLTGPAVVTYLWQGLILMDMRTLPNKKSMNFDCGTINNQPVDACGHLHYYLKNNPSLKIKYYSEPTPDAAGIKITELSTDQESLQRAGYDSNTINFILDYKKFDDPYSMEFHLDKNFIHYRAGGNWIQKPASYHNKKITILTNYIDTIIQSYCRLNSSCVSI